jgi:hypothetical protein
MAGWVLMLTGVAGALLPRRGYGWLRRRMVLNSGVQQRPEANVRPRKFNRMLVPGGLITEETEAPVTTVVDGEVTTVAPVESDTIEQYIEE